MNGKTFEDLAVAGYKAYCKQAGGMTFEGRSLPDWSDIGGNFQDCWIASAKEVIAQNAAPLIARKEAAVDNFSVQASRSDDSCTTWYEFTTPAPVQVPAPASPAYSFNSGGGGDFGGAGASGSYDSSSSDSSSSDSGSSDFSSGSSD